MRVSLAGLLATTFLCAAVPGGVAWADIAVSGNDAHTVLDNGSQVAAKDGKPDTVSIIDLSGAPRIIATVEAPGSVVGPPTAVAVAADESFAIVTGATKVTAGGAWRDRAERPGFGDRPHGQAAEGGAEPDPRERVRRRCGFRRTGRWRSW